MLFILYAGRISDLADIQYDPVRSKVPHLKITLEDYFELGSALDMIQSLKLPTCIQFKDFIFTSRVVVT